MSWLSVGVESLVAQVEKATAPPYEVIVVGSGYGGAVAACRFAEAGYRVCLLERGREIRPGEFPDDIGALPGHVRIHRHGDARIIGLPDALFDLRLHQGVTVVLANALGGGSQINANVAVRADPLLFQQPCWPAEIRNDPSALDRWYARVEDMLDVAPYPHACSKADALESLAAPLSAWLASNGGPRGTARFVRPPLAVNRREGANRFGIPQRECTGCGDCVTGCNVGAKNTLTMNYLPQAKQYGAKIYTGATVLAVKPAQNGGATLWFCESDADWSGHFARAGAGERDLDQQGITRLAARLVILAAGSLGSTEILKRSSELGLLSVSPRLGKDFSGNGDALGFVFDERRPVNGVGRGAAPTGRPHPPFPGPAIVGMIDVRADGESMLIEDGILPGALAGVGHELVTNASLLHQLTAWRMLRDGPQEDPLGLSDEALQRTQVLLFMGHDKHKGCMELEQGRIVAKLDPQESSPIRDALFELAPTTVGGVAFADPMAQPLPPAVSDLAEKPPQGNAIVVHPLGGCPMGDDGARGAVNHAGMLFSGDRPDAVYDSICVWDGAAMPTSIGVNPFLTIAALAERAAELGIQRLGGARPHQKAPVLSPASRAVSRIDEREEVRVVLHETLRGKLRLWGKPGAAPADTAVRWSIHIADMERFLRDPQHRTTKLSGSMTLPALHGDMPWSVESGEFAMLVRVPSTRLERTARGLGAWLVKRGYRELWEGLLALLAGKTSGTKLPELLRRLITMANHAGERREMRYAVRLLAPTGERHVLKGKKILRYAPGSNPWDALLDLRVELRNSKRRIVATGTLRLDLVSLVEDELPQVRAAPGSPKAFLALGGFALFILRAVLSIHFWDLRASQYPPHARLKRDDALLPDKVKVNGATVAGERHWFFVQQSPAHDERSVRLALTRFSPPHPGGYAPVMLMAGFAQASSAYLAEPLEEDLVRHLLKQGFEVWLFDYRTSTALPSSRSQCSLDDVAQYDIPAAVDYIRACARVKKIAVMGHCMGSATLAMSLLSGRLEQSGLCAAVLSQVPPHIVGGTYSQWRRQLAALFRDVLRLEMVNLAADDRAEAWERVMDAIFAALPLGDGPCPVHGQRREEIPTCRRVSGIIGPLYLHRNMKKTHAQLDRWFGLASISVFNQIAKFFEYERLVSADGGNIYVRDATLRRMRLPVLLLHGAENEVFDPESAHRSLEHLQRVNGPHYYELFEPPGYAHFDCLVGDNAHADIFPRISGFFRRNAR